MPLKLPKHLLSRMLTYVKGAFVSIQVKMSVTAIVRQNRERNKTSSEKLRIHQKQQFESNRFKNE